MALATAEQLAALLGVAVGDVPGAAAAIERASATVKAYTQQHLEYGEHTTVLEPLFAPAARLFLPQRPVVEVLEVHDLEVLDGDDLVPADRYVLDGGVLIARGAYGAYWAGLTRVRYTAGYSDEAADLEAGAQPVPDTLRETVLGVAARIVVNPAGLSNERAGASFSAGYSVTGDPHKLTTDEREALNDYRVPVLT